MSNFVRTAVVAACLALALPGAALAQSAGDDQYVDPLNGVTGGGSGSGGGSGGSGSSGSSGTAGTAGAGSAASGSSANGSALPGELARTGAELPLTAGAGLLLLAGGLGLRRFSGVRR